MSNQAALIIAIGIAAAGAAVGGVHTSVSTEGFVFVTNRFTGTTKACGVGSGRFVCRVQEADAR